MEKRHIFTLLTWRKKVRNGWTGSLADLDPLCLSTVGQKYHLTIPFMAIVCFHCWSFMYYLYVQTASECHFALYCSNWCYRFTTTLSHYIMITFFNHHATPWALGVFWLIQKIVKHATNWLILFRAVATIGRTEVMSSPLFSENLRVLTTWGKFTFYSYTEIILGGVFKSWYFWDTISWIVQRSNTTKKTNKQKRNKWQF